MMNKKMILHNKVKYNFTLLKKKFSLFHPDLFPLKNDIIRSSFTLDDVKLPPLNEITGGRIFNAPI